MLFFLQFACEQGLDLESYEDDAVGRLAKGEDGGRWVSSVTLRPRVSYRGPAPSREVERELHDAAHHHCFLARSVKSDVVVELP